MCSTNNSGATNLAEGALGVQAAGTILATTAAYRKGVADKNAYNIQAGVAENNAQLDAARASDAIVRGQTAVEKSDLAARNLMGTQRATMSANGVDLNSGSPLNILSDTEFMADNSADILKANALKEAWGYNVAAANDTSNAKLLRYRAGSEDPDLDAATTLLTGASSVASTWYNARKFGAGI